MTDPIINPLGCRPLPVDEGLHEATGARADVVGARPIPGESAGTVAAHLATEGTHAGIAAAEAAGLLEGGAAFVAGAITGPLMVTIGYAIGIEHAYTEGDRQNRELHREILRGAVAAFEGRTDSPDVQAECERSPGYAQGVRSAREMGETSPARAELFRAIAGQVRAAKRGGMLAVAEGQDRGPEFDARYQDDLAFRHGVDYMRRLDAENPALFATESERMRDMVRQVEHGRCATIRG